MPPPRRMPTRALERARRGKQFLRHAGRLEPPSSIDDHARDDGASCARTGVLELDGIRTRIRVPRHAHDFRPAARVRL